jgi:hypothetical protein
MKKLAFLFLLTAVLAVFSFAVEGIGDFTAAIEIGVPNTGSANGEKPLISAEPSLTFARSFGNFGLEAALGTEFSFDFTDVDDRVYDDIYVILAPSYTLEAGPGSLSFAVTVQAFFPIAKDARTSFDGDGQDKFWLWADPSINYTLEPGFGELSFEIGTDHLTIQNGLADNYGVEPDIYFKAGIELPVGFGFWVQPYYKLQLHDNQDPAYFHFNVDAHYRINDLILVGLEFDAGEAFEGDTIIPYVEVSFGAASLWARVEIDDVNSSGDFTVNPYIGFSFAF